MKLHELKPARGSRKSVRRVGRGPGSGRGKTAARGSKGQLSRSGYKSRRGFEGGQMPLHRRLPKRGFHNFARIEFAVVNLDQLARTFAAGAEVDPPALLKHRLVRDPKGGIKVLGRGELKVALTVKAHKFSQSAADKIQSAGGTAVVLG
ncbi:MAG TPA: 50S ribosomal protein L15 [Acidobacteriota bacterium]